MKMHERGGGQAGELSGSEWFKVAERATAERQTRPKGSVWEIISGVPNALSCQLMKTCAPLCGEQV